MMGEFVKFKGEHPEHYGINPDKIYIVQGWATCGGIKLFNSRGKLRSYPHHLFEDIKVNSLKEDETPEIKDLMDRWLHDQISKEDSRIAYAILQEREKVWLSSLGLKKGIKVKFKSGKEAGRYEGRIFTCNSTPSSRSMFHASVRLVGLYGFYNAEDLEIIEEHRCAFCGHISGTECQCEEKQ